LYLPMTGPEGEITYLLRDEIMSSKHGMYNARCLEQVLKERT
jgi:hypothetical protein